jgi:hypothetical protein
MTTKHKRRWSSSSVTAKMWIKATKRYNFTSTRRAVKSTEDVEKLESLHTSGNVKWFSSWGKQLTVSHNVKAIIPAMPLLGRYLERLKTGTQTSTCWGMLTAAIFTTAIKLKISLNIHQKMNEKINCGIHTMEY